MPRKQRKGITDRVCLANKKKYPGKRYRKPPVH